MELVKVKINGIELEVPKNKTVLEAAKDLNILISTFCYHEKLPIFGGCRMCLVYDVKAKRSIIACGSYVYDGMEIETENEKVKEDRKFILQMLFTRHPLDCPICDKAGECDLQNWGTYWGPQDNMLSFITPFEKVRPEEDWKSNLLEYVSNRCVLCMKCVSVCDNINKSHSLTSIERGFETLISPVKKPIENSSCEMCGLCVDICPVGAILFKPFKFNSRAWLLKETYTHCGFCSLGCPVAVNHDGKKIYRIRSTAELEVCGKPYLGYDSFNTNRLKYPLINSNKVSLQEATNKTVEILNKSPEKTAIVVSPYLSNEIIQSINKIANKTGSYITSIITLDILPLLEGFGEYTPPKLENVKKWIVVGNDITNTNPVITYKMDKKVIAFSKNPSRIRKLYPLVYDIDGNIEERLMEVADKNSVIVYSNYYYGMDAFNFGKTLKKIQQEKDSKILILPQYPNSFGVVNYIENLSYLPEVISKIENGEIENIILFGEDLAEVVEEDKLKHILQTLKNKVLFTPFEDGLAFVSDIVLPLNTWIEEDGEYSFAFEIKKVKSSIKTPFKTVDILSELLDKLEEKPYKQKTQNVYSNIDYIKVEEVDIWDISFFSRRSENLTNWKIKNEGVLDEY